MNKMLTGSTPGLPCHPQSAWVKSGYRLACPVCGSFFDEEFAGGSCGYDAAYPAARGHHSPEIGGLKAATLRRWLGLLGLDPRRESVCEVGFGGGACLLDLFRAGAKVCGIEAVAENVRFAASLGLPPDRLWLSGAEPGRLPEKISLWLFQDSFEHLPEPEPFLGWLEANSAEGSRVLLVAPDAGSLSRRLLGRAWPHRVSDHRFHWSAGGIAAVFGRHGFRIARRFRPLKKISPEIIARHPSRSAFASAAKLLAPALPASIWLNIGELGLLLEREGK